MNRNPRIDRAKKVGVGTLRADVEAVSSFDKRNEMLTNQTAHRRYSHLTPFITDELGYRQEVAAPTDHRLRPDKMLRKDFMSVALSSC